MMNYEPRAAKEALSKISDELINLGDELYGIEDKGARLEAIARYEELIDAMSKLNQLLKL
jgi:hypothetical protein